MAREKWEAGMKNNRTWLYYFYRLLNLAVSVFEWKGLPDTVDSMFLEKTLFFHGKALFFNDDVLGNICLPFTDGGEWTIYDIPTKRMAYGSNIYSKMCDISDSVIIYNNYVRQPDVQNIMYFCDRLWDVTRSIDVNISVQKTPFIIRAQDSSRFTLKNIMAKVKSSEDLVMVDKNLDMNSINVLDLRAPLIAPELKVVQTQIWNEALSYLGINNIAYNKAERLITDEVNSNVEEIKASRMSRLNARKEACKDINNMFGLNVSVDFRKEINTIPPSTEMFESEERSDNNGNV